jgi:hypothetical protein
LDATTEKQHWGTSQDLTLRFLLDLGLNILRHDKSRKLSVPRKMRALMMDEDYLDTVLEARLGKVSFKK